MPKVEVKQTIESLKIYINELLFVCIKRSEFIGFQSWKEGGDKFCIEFYSTSQSIITEYDTRELWEEILKLLDSAYIF